MTELRLVTFKNLDFSIINGLASWVVIRARLLSLFLPNPIHSIFRGKSTANHIFTLFSYQDVNGQFYTQKDTTEFRKSYELRLITHSKKNSGIKESKFQKRNSRRRLKHSIDRLAIPTKATCEGKNYHQVGGLLMTQQWGQHGQAIYRYGQMEKALV